jgi:peptide/nickel transport system substrate-binding protein
MKRKLIGLILCCLLATALILSSCATKSTTTSTTATKPVTTSSTTTAAWWSTLGTPKYGGTLNLQSLVDFTMFDPYDGKINRTIMNGYMESLFNDNWTLDPNVFSYKSWQGSNEFETGWLAQSFEFTDPHTLVVHLKHGITWQNIPPANGREFVASDVAFHYNRMVGIGDGYTKPNTYWATQGNWLDLQSVTAQDKYTVVFYWKTPNPEAIMENMNHATVDNYLENPEAVKQWGDLKDWHHAIGTGPFTLDSVVSGSTYTFVKNTAYWAFDERYPNNKLPYMDKIIYNIMPNKATAMSALRTGKIDFVDSVALQDAQALTSTNPSILQISIPARNPVSIDIRVDKAPFTDIRVRQAIQMAINLPEIASTYYKGTCDPWPSTLVSNYQAGWGYPYTQWPQSLKDQYAFNPTEAKNLLTAAGFPNGFNTDLVCENSMDLALFELVKSYLANVNINLDIRPMDQVAFNAFALTNHLTDALVARNQGQLGRQYEPILQLMTYQWMGGNNTSDNVGRVNDPVFEAYYSAAMASTSVDEIKSVVKSAAQRIAEQHYSISLINNVSFFCYQPWLKGYTGQMLSLASPPGRFSFYGARFWIDQSVK